MTGIKINFTPATRKIQLPCYYQGINKNGLPEVMGGINKVGLF